MITASELDAIDMVQDAAILRAEKRQRVGIKRALDHAARAVRLDWKRKAEHAIIASFGWLEHTQPEQTSWLAEDVVPVASSHFHMEDPPDKRAWGGVFQSLAKQGIIVQAGYGKAKSSNLSPKVLWAVVDNGGTNDG